MQSAQDACHFTKAMIQTNNDYVESNGVILKLLRCDFKSFLDKCWYYDRGDDDGDETAVKRR